LRVPAQFASAGTACGTTITVRRFTAKKPVRLSALDLLAPSRASDAEVRLDRPPDAVGNRGSSSFDAREG
jgi:hypothetical protein